MAFVAGLIAAEKTLPWARAVNVGTAALLLALGSPACGGDTVPQGSGATTGDAESTGHGVGAETTDGEGFESRTESESLELLAEPLRRFAINLRRGSVLAQRGVGLHVFVQIRAGHEVLRIELLDGRCGLHRSL